MAKKIINATSFIWLMSGRYLRPPLNRWDVGLFTWKKNSRKCYGVCTWGANLSRSVVDRSASATFVGLDSSVSGTYEKVLAITVGKWLKPYARSGGD